MNQSGTDVPSLIQAARDASLAGDGRRAETLYQQALAVAPNNTRALNGLGNHYLRLGAAAQAVELFRRVTRIDRHPVPYLNLGNALRKAGDRKAALAAYEQSLVLNPYFSQVHFEKAELLQELGAHHPAIVCYQRFLDCAAHDPARDRLGSRLTRAEAIVAEHRRELEDFLAPRLEASLETLPAPARSRMAECVDILLGKARRYVPEPNFLYVPSLAPIAFYDRELFPWFAELEEATGDIRDELITLIDFDGARQGFEPYIKRKAGEPITGWEKLNFSLDWSVYMFWEHGRRIDENCARCPKTAAVLDSMPLCDTPNRTPTANFSLLKPHTHIPPHSGETNSRVIIHLALIVPERCSFRVGNETRPWIEGEAFAFDDSISHEARNDSDQLRAILMLDTWNPFISEPEREVIKTLVLGLDAFANETAR